MRRLIRLRELMKQRNLDGILISGRPNTIYLSGFSGSTSFFLVSHQSAWLIVDFRYTIQAKQQVFEGIDVIEQQDSFTSALNQLIGENQLKTVGFEGSALTFSEYLSFKEKLSNAQEFVNLGECVSNLRLVKDAQEIELIQEAVTMGDKVFSQILKSIKPGMQEIELAAEIDYTMRKLGAKGSSFDTIIASGERSAMCHATPGNNVLKSGDALVMDFGVKYKNYCSDMTRTVFIGEPSDKLKEIYRIVLQAQEAALDCLVAGLPAKDADSAAREIIHSAGYGNCFGHGLGHGVGIEIHEDPRLSQKSEAILEEGMVFTVEPGIYVEGLGGVRIEDMAVLENGKLRNFTASTKELIII